MFSLTQDILSHLKLPIGYYNKDAVRRIAKRLKLNSYKRKESQEICFVKNDDLKGFLKENLKGNIKPGRIKDEEGKVLAQHQGTCFYTIGQRRGLRIPYGKPIYVVDINPKTGDIKVGDYAATLKRTIRVRDVRWSSPPDRKQQYFNANVKIRYKHEKAKAKLKIMSSKTCKVTFLKPQNAPTPGQVAVFYDRDKVIGGGWID